MAVMCGEVSIGLPRTNDWIYVKNGLCYGYV